MATPALSIEAMTAQCLEDSLQKMNLGRWVTVGSTRKHPRFTGRVERVGIVMTPNYIEALIGDGKDGDTVEIEFFR